MSTRRILEAAVIVLTALAAVAKIFCNTQELWKIEDSDTD